MGFQSLSACFGEEIFLRLLSGIEPRFLGRPSHSLVVIRTDYTILEPYWYCTSSSFWSCSGCHKIIQCGFRGYTYVHVWRKSKNFSYLPPYDEVHKSVAQHLVVSACRVCVCVCVWQRRVSCHVEVLNSKVGVLCFNWKLGGRETCLLIVRENKRFRKSERIVVKRVY
jgi:hypothetical protein